MKCCFLVDSPKIKVPAGVSEVILPYHPDDLSIYDAIGYFLDDNKSIILDIQKDAVQSMLNNHNFDSNFEIDKLDSLISAYNIKIRIPDSFCPLVQNFKDRSIPFFYSKGASDWQEFHKQLKDGVSDIYIVESLNFSLWKVKMWCQQKNVKIRVYPNVVQSSYSKKINQFFIRPDDLESYKDVIDVIEFWCQNWQQQTYYKVYFEQGKWFGNLKEIITGLDSEVDNREISPTFAKHRLLCNHRCIADPSCSCHACSRAELHSKIMKEMTAEMLEENKSS